MGELSLEKTMSNWPTTQRAHSHMEVRQRQNRGRRVTAEDWMAMHLRRTPYRWTRQAQWGFRLFDFWCRDIGVAVEVDGPNHDAVRDAESDAKMMSRSGILVLRVRNWNIGDLSLALETLQVAMPWNARRRALGLKPLKV